MNFHRELPVELHLNGDFGQVAAQPFEIGYTF